MLTNNAWLVDVTGHDSDLALTRGDYAWAIRSKKSRLVLPHELLFHVNHVVLRDALGDADNEWHFSIDGLHDGGGSAWRWHIDDRGRGSSLSSGLEK